MTREFKYFIGVDLGGGKGKTTAAAVLEASVGTVPARPGPAYGPARIVALAPRPGDSPLFDEHLVDFIEEWGPSVLLAMDAPLTVPACVRCTLPSCPGQAHCEVPAVVAMNEIARGAPETRDNRRGKPHVTPYTQRAGEVYLHRHVGIAPRETLGQGMGPLTARAAHLVRRLAPRFALNRNLLEVYPKATLKLLGFHQRYKKHLLERERRAEILSALSDEISFAPGVWREECVQSDHVFDAVICAFTGYLWARDAWQVPPDLAHLADEDGWIWSPPGRLVEPDDEGDAPVSEEESDNLAPSEPRAQSGA